MVNKKLLIKERLMTTLKGNQLLSIKAKYLLHFEKRGFVPCAEVSNYLQLAFDKLIERENYLSEKIDSPYHDKY